MIEIRDLYKYYGAYRALGPISTSIGEGEIVGLLGLNGAGKTTTLRILACDLLPSAGSVRVGGFDVVEQPEQVRRLIGYLPDTPPLYEEMSVRQYLAFAAKLRGVAVGDVAAAVEHACRATHLLDVIDDPISALSHGYRQRVGIAQAIVHRPKLVVLDEPSGGLDPVQIREMRDLVRGLGKHHTVIVSSHNLPEITEMCDRLLVIGKGEIVASGSEVELVSRWMQHQHFDLLVRLPEPLTAAQFAEQLREIADVKGVQLAKVREAGERLAAYVIEAAPSARAPIARHALQRDCELLELARSERELESVFARLAAGQDAPKEAA